MALKRPTAVELRRVPGTPTDSPLGKLPVWVRGRDALADDPVLREAAITFMTPSAGCSSTGLSGSTTIERSSLSRAPTPGMIDPAREGGSVNLDLTEDQAFFRDTTRKFLEIETPLTTVRELYESRDGFDRLWWEKAAELGWTLLFVPEAQGGGSLSGHPTEDAVIVAEEMGRLVAPGPFLPVNVVAAAIAWSGSQLVKANILPGLVTGNSVTTWACGEPGNRWWPELFETTIEKIGDDLVVTGVKAYVESVGAVDQVLVTGRSGAGYSQVIIPAETAGVTVTTGRSLDMTRRFGSASFEAVRLPASALVGEFGAARPTVERQSALALAIQCAEMVGVAERALEMTLDYGRNRIAFGRPIVSFQSLKHRIADMTVWLEGSKALTENLAEAIDAAAPDVGRLASVAKAYIGAHCLDIVDDCIQITGGLGVTWEHDIHLYNRRAAVDRVVYGTPEQHKERLTTLLRGEAQ
jgi:alkylation response protein AidB-like acyl-CoA dehydrogenase